VKTFSMRPARTEIRVRVSCPVCGGSETALHWACGEFSFERCRNCGHVYQNPQPRFEDLKERYADEYFDYELTNDKTFFTLMQQGLSDIQFQELEAHLTDNRHFLDVGCATGVLLEHLSSRGWDVQGVEICEPAARYGRDVRKVPIHIGTLEDAAFADNTFSFVHFSHVIEHVPDPRGFLSEVRRVLQPGGFLVVVTPDIASFQAALYGSRWRSAIADHLHLFSHNGLFRLLSDTGFHVQKRKSWGGIPAGAAPNWLKRPADLLAKRLNVGDVMLFLATA